MIKIESQKCTFSVFISRNTLSCSCKEIILMVKLSDSYEGAMSRWLMLKPDADTPPREEEMVRNVTAKV